jgi:hypothetical protein
MKYTIVPQSISLRYLSLVSAALLSLANRFKLFPLLVQRPATLVAACGLLVALTALPTHAQPCAPPPPGLVAWWPLDETGGSTVSDHSVFANTGIATTKNGTGISIGPPGTGIVSAPGFVGNGLHFYFGSLMKVAPSSSLTFGTTTSFTIDAWIKGSESPIVGNYNIYSNLGYFLYYANGGTLNFQIGTGGLPQTYTGPPISPGVWTFVAVVVDRTNKLVTLYAAASSSAALSAGLLNPGLPGTFDASSGLNIGGCPGNPHGCDTIIDEVEVFNRALLPAELGNIFNAKSAGKCNIPPKKGMTWLHTASNSQAGTITVGCSGCDAGHGDTLCTQQLPLLCIYKPSPLFQLPLGLPNSDRYNLWSGGVVATTQPIAGNTFGHISAGTPLSPAANDYCAAQFGFGWRVAEFHDGWGWNFQAYGGTVSAPTVPSTRFWVHINDQKAANCWATP